MEIKVTLPDSIRSKKNSKRIFKRGKYTAVLPSKAYVKWEEQARLTTVGEAIYKHGYLLSDLLKDYYFNHVSVSAQIYFKGPQPDLSGCLESIGDCMEGYLWENDKQIISWDGSRLHHDLKNPRTELTVVYG